MIARLLAATAAAISVAAFSFAAPATAKELKVLSEKTVTGFGHVESCVYDPASKAIFTSDFGPELKPADKDGKGKITKVSLDGKILEDGFLPAKGQVLNKPKGLWIKGRRLWATDIDSVWVFDLKTKEGRKLPLPGVTFANDPAVVGDTLYVSDNRSDRLVKVVPADFLKSKKDPTVTPVFAGKGIFPNGLYPGRNGTLYLVGMESKEKPHGIYRLPLGKDKPMLLSDNIGLLDGLYVRANGDIIATDWVSGSLFQWNKKMGMHKLATDFKGPADLCVVLNAKGTLVIVPDLVKGELRFVQLGR